MNWKLRSAQIYLWMVLVRKGYQRKRNLDALVKSNEFNYRWLSKKVHIQGVVFFQERGYTRSMPSV